MIVVTGATGNVGRPLVRALAGERVTAVSRRISAADVPEGVRPHPADLIRPAELAPALVGARGLFLLTSGDFLQAGADLGKVLDVVRDSGVRRVVLLSSQGVGAGVHPSDLEDAVTASGLDWTLLRPGTFQSNALQWAESVRKERTVAAPFGDVAIPAVHPADIAEVAAAALREDGHAGAVYELTGPALISPREQAAAIGEALGEPVGFTELTRARARAAMAGFMPTDVADRTLDMLGMPPADLLRVSSDVPRVLGRPARTFAAWAADNAAAFR